MRSRDASWTRVLGRSAFIGCKQAVACMSSVAGGLAVFREFPFVDGTTQKDPANSAEMRVLGERQTFRDSKFCQFAARRKRQVFNVLKLAPPTGIEPVFSP